MPPSVLEALGSDQLEIFRFWYRSSEMYPHLSKVAIRLFATPPSSCASERNFNVVNRIVTPQRNRLNSSTIEDHLLLRSFIATGADNSSSLNKFCHHCKQILFPSCKFNLHTFFQNFQYFLQHISTLRFDFNLSPCSLSQFFNFIFIFPCFLACTFYYSLCGVT